MNVINHLTALIDILLKGKIDLELPTGSKEEALKYLHSPYLLAAMNPLITSANQPSASNFKKMEEERFTPSDPESALLIITRDPTQGCFVSVRYRQLYFSGSGAAPFTMWAKELSPTIIAVTTEGLWSLRMIETYTVHEDRVEKTVKIPSSWFVTNARLEKGLKWNQRVWNLGLDGENVANRSSAGVGSTATQVKGDPSKVK